ncbi:NUDIX hydrolase [Agromyces albus]|uniref:NUDIX domain-containing protein n=1 Tax=Agromyces albus TaxID=205332 RepID=A0A4Q2KTE3_9MICO|nr:NUDIX domain-containing protein [Agromyces albus]RXZ68784.1 NUDIX domain-containing protein [Agromyces albus]
MTVSDGVSYTEEYAASHGRFSLIPAVYVVLRRGDEVLLQLRRGTGYFDEHWACGAAGHVEQGESLLTAAVRETREELGVDVDPATLTTLTVMHRTGGVRGRARAIEERLDVFFSATAWVGEPRPLEDKAAELGWFPLDALPEPVVPHELAVLDAMRRGTLAPITPYGF